MIVAFLEEKDVLPEYVRSWMPQYLGPMAVNTHTSAISVTLPSTTSKRLKSISDKRLGDAASPTGATLSSEPSDDAMGIICINHHAIDIAILQSIGVLSLDVL